LVSSGERTGSNRSREELGKSVHLICQPERVGKESPSFSSHKAAKAQIPIFRGTRIYGVSPFLILCGFVSLCDYFSPFPVPRFHGDKSYLLKNIFAENVKIIVIRYYTIHRHIDSNNFG